MKESTLALSGMLSVTLYSKPMSLYVKYQAGKKSDDKTSIYVYE